MLGKYIVGVDLGQQNDYTVLTVVAPNLLINNEMEYEVPYIYRYPLKTSYVYVVKHIQKTMEERGFKDDYLLIIDHTGVGRPVVDLFNENNIPLVGVTITGGNKASWTSPREVSVPKWDIVSSLQVSIQCGKLKLSKKMHELNRLIDEMINFTATSTRKGKGKFEAASGQHDDMVLSLGLAIWYCEYKFRRGKRLRVIGGR